MCTLSTVLVHHTAKNSPDSLPSYILQTFIIDGRGQYVQLLQPLCTFEPITTIYSRYRIHDVCDDNKRRFSG